MEFCCRCCRCKKVHRIRSSFALRRRDTRSVADVADKKNLFRKVSLGGETIFCKSFRAREHSATNLVERAEQPLAQRIKGCFCKKIHTATLFRNKLMKC